MSNTSKVLDIFFIISESKMLNLNNLERTCGNECIFSGKYCNRFLVGQSALIDHVFPNSTTADNQG